MRVTAEVLVQVQEYRLKNRKKPVFKSESESWQNVGGHPIELLSEQSDNPSMSMILLGIYLLIVGINTLMGSNIPGWVLGLLALLCGILILAGNFKNWRGV